MKPVINLANIEQQPLKTFAEKAYLDYSMYVILDRALPHLSDGLKPVQRRIVYAMSELGLAATAKFKKSARTIGDVLGKYHPHGDTACYEAMVLMAQPFSYRYPLVEGQGNWGSLDDPKSFAAMRYTEARLSPYAEILLKELGQGTVTWQPNFDGTLEEPRLLPARLPNVLLNGTTGIAVGMATDILPHNLREVVAACILLLDNPEAKLKEVCALIKGPDFPTEAEIITPKSEILEIYRTGLGGLRARAAYTIEEGEIVIHALPYQVSGAKVMTQIAAQMQAKKLPLVADIRDESDHENPTRIVIVPRSNRIDVGELMAHLFATTDLESSYRVNFNMIGIDGRPQVKNLLTILTEWLQFRTETVRKRLQYRLEKVLARLHILQGLMAVYLNLDEVIAIIRHEDEPKPLLMKKFKLTEIQAEAILETKLRHLAKLEEMKIRDEEQELNAERDDLEKTLASKKKLQALIKKELEEDAEKYGDERRSPLVIRAEAKAISEEEMVPTEPITVVLSQQGWIRAAKGHEIDGATLSYKAGDGFKMKVCGKSNQLAAFLDSHGRSYSIPSFKLPSARGQGEPLTGKFEPEIGTTFTAVLIGEDSDQYVVASNLGYGFVVKLADFYCKNKSGKALLTVSEGAAALSPQRITSLEDDYLAAVTNEGRLLLFPVASLPALAKGKGNKIINISKEKFAAKEEYVVVLAVLPENGSLVISSGKRNLTLTWKDLVNYQGERGRRGNKLPRGFRAVDDVKAMINP